MLRSFRLGSAFGIPLCVHSSFFLLPLALLFLSWPMGYRAILFMEAVLFSMFACVLLHELGHVLMARAFGITTRDVTLYPIGGVARLESMGSRPFEEICIALAGPAVNLFIVLFLSPLVATVALAGLCISPGDAMLGEGGPWTLVAGYLMVLWVSNIVLMAFNMLPAFPMDGGRVFRALLTLRLGALWATEIAAAVGLVFAGLLIAGGLWMRSLNLVLVAAFVATVGQMEVIALRRREARRKMRTVPVVAPVVVAPALAEFSGVMWDRDNRVWVRWVDGRPVEA